MIPTRDTIEGVSPWVGAGIATWLRDMRDEIDRLNRETSTLKEFNEAALAEQAKLRAELDAAHTEAALARDALSKANGERDAVARHRDDLIALCRIWEKKLVAAGIKRQTTVSDGIAELARQRDEFRSLSRPPKMVAKIESLAEDMLSESIDNPGDDPADLVALEERAGTDDERFVVLRRDILEMANLQSALAKVTAAPSEGEIALWEEEALWEQENFEDDADDPDTFYRLRRSEIAAAVALMRRAATASDAKLRELLQWLGKNGSGGWVSTPAMEGKIVSLFADPNRLTEPAKPAEPATTDDTRELVAQLAHLMANHMRCSDDALDERRCDLADAIAAKLRGGK